MIRAVAIRIYGDKELAEPMAAAIMPVSEDIAAIRAELGRMKQLEAQLAVRQRRDRDYYRQKIDEAQLNYGTPAHGGLASAALCVICLLGEIVYRCYSYLSAWNREA